MLDAKTQTAEQNVPIHRAEPRFPSYGHGELAVIGPARPERPKARIVDVSRSGLQVEISEPVESGSSIELRLPNISVFGQEGSSPPHDLGGYRLGVLLEPPGRPLT